MSMKEKDTTKWVQKNVNKKLRPIGSKPKADALLSESDVPAKKTEGGKSGKFALAVLTGGIIAVLARGVKKSKFYK